MRTQLLLVILGLALVQSSFLAGEQVQAGYRSEYIPKTHPESSLIKNLLPHQYTTTEELPQAFSWDNVNGTSYITKSLNQHIPQYCGSCWAHGALSALADRLKIARKAQGQEYNLAIQYILNCGNAGSCYGGDHLATYEFISEGHPVPFDTCLQYEACSSDSSEGSCKGRDFTCSAMNTCRTCSTFTSNGGKCAGIERYPNVSVAEYGPVSGADKMKAEIYKRGPIAIGINAEPVLKYQGGIFSDKSAGRGVNHVVSAIGWGYDEASQKQYWIVRNSWGQYWGEQGYIRIEMGDNIIGVESNGAWATVGTWTENNYGCYEDGSNCQGTYVDPATFVKEFQ